MPGIRQKGKIPATEWAAIVARHAAREPIARIARDYGCTAPAIRYIVKRAASQVNGAAPAPAVKAARGQGRGLDPRVRERITGEIAAFLYTLDTAVGEPRPEAMAALRQSADRLMRAAARLRIELERVGEGSEA